MKSLKQDKAEQARKGFADRKVGKLREVFGDVSKQHQRPSLQCLAGTYAWSSDQVPADAKHVGAGKKRKRLNNGKPKAKRSKLVIVVNYNYDSAGER
jgi:hypothetical protein